MTWETCIYLGVQLGVSNHINDYDHGIVSSISLGYPLGTGTSRTLTVRTCKVASGELLDLREIELAKWHQLAHTTNTCTCVVCVYNIERISYKYSVYMARTDVMSHVEHLYH